MNTEQAATLFEALSSEARLNVFRLLVKHAPEGLVAGDIAKLLGIPSTNLSFHLKGLVHSNLVHQEKEGRFLRYQANLTLMLETIAWLTAECCAANPQHCKSLREASGLTVNRAADLGSGLTCGPHICSKTEKNT